MHSRPVLFDETNTKFELAQSLTLFRTNPKKPPKSVRDHLGFCDDPENPELAERQSDEEFEYVDEYFPLMTKVTSVQNNVDNVEETAQTAVRMEVDTAQEASEKVLNEDLVSGELDSAVHEEMVNVVKHGVT